MSGQGKKSTEVDEYISSFPLTTQQRLEELRLCIWQAAPNVSELMNYKMPAFALTKGGKRDQQIMIAGFSKHVGFYSSAIVIDAYSDRIAGYKFSKGSIQFPLDKPIPEGLVIEMVKYRLSHLLK